MTRGECFLIFLFGVWTVIALGLSVASSSWMIYQRNSDDWRDKIIGNLRVSDTVSILKKSWETKPFVDLVVTTDEKCPSSHPDDVVYEMWLGTSYVCDRLQNANERSYEFEQCMEKEARKIDEEERPMSDSFHVKGLPPVIQNKIRGVRYCGKRSKLSFREMQRQVRDADEKYVCPEPYLPCIEDSGSIPDDSHDFVICYHPNKAKRL